MSDRGQGSIGALVLFDVDGTLLITGGASTRCIRRAAERVLGPRFRWGPITVGTLDPEIFAQVAAHSGVADATGLIDEYRRIYLDELRSELAKTRGDVRVMPGVPGLLDDLGRDSAVAIGLLTGNFERAVELKLDAAGIDRSCFRVGAFAEHGATRADLVSAALAQLAAATGQRLDPAQVILVGDTPRDVACARATGCAVVAVATGKYSVQELATGHPDVLVADLTDRRPIRALIDRVAVGG